MKEAEDTVDDGVEDTIDVPVLGRLASCTALFISHLWCGIERSLLAKVSISPQLSMLHSCHR